MICRAPLWLTGGVEDSSPEEIEQLARSVAMSGALGDRDRLRVVELLRRLAVITRRSPGR